MSGRVPWRSSPPGTRHGLLVYIVDLAEVEIEGEITLEDRLRAFKASPTWLEDARLMRDRKKAPVHWFGGKWFLVRDYSLPGGVWKTFSCGALAGVASKTIVAPVERVKLLAQLEGTKSFSKIIREVWHLEGPSGFWKGCLIDVMGAESGSIKEIQDVKMKRLQCPRFV